MRLSISTSSFGSPMRKMERKEEPSAMKPRIRMPGMSSGLGSVKPHLMSDSPTRMQTGGDVINQLYQARRGNAYNPDPFARQVLNAQRQLSSQFFNPNMRAFPGSTAQFPYAAGGPAPPDDEDGQAVPDPMDLMEDDQSLGPQEQQEKQVVVEAMLALEGKHPDPEAAIERFVKLFGKGALEELQEMMSQRSRDDEDEEEQPGEGDEEEEEEPSSGESDEDEEPPSASAAPDDDEEPAAAGGGLLSGPGSGQSDEIEAATPSGRRVLLSDGEYVVDAPTVAALGDGSTSAGARRLDDFRKQVRKQAYGHDKQAKPMNKGGRAFTVEFGI